jgi:hypothetical protein
MPRIESNPECVCCGKTINIDNEESIKVEDGLIHIECEEEYAASSVGMIDWRETQN